MTDQSISELLQTQIKLAAEKKHPLNIVAGGSKSFLGRTANEETAETLNVSKHRGIINYDPRELVITARSGTTINEIETVLDDAGQMLAFEPPSFNDDSTLGGTIACGLSGPRRPYAGAARDFVLGCKLINGNGDIMQFGGQVMKNVAGYDVSRLMAGAYGTLGVLLEVSLKVLPRPAASITLFHEASADDAIAYISHLLTQALPIDAACYYKGQTYIRISGSQQAVDDAQKKIAGETLNKHSHFWQRLKDHQLSFFNTSTPVWRIAVKPATPALPLQGEWLLDWGGGQRWFISNEQPHIIRAVVQQHGGHATLFRGGDRTADVFQPLSNAMQTLHQRLKTSFDPAGILNRGRMYAEI